MALPAKHEEFKTDAVPFADRLMLDAQSAAEMLSVSVQTLAKLPILRVTLPGTRCVRYRMIDLEGWVRSL